MDTEIEEDDFDFKPKRSSSPLPWILFCFVLIASAVGLFFGYNMLTAEQEQAAVALKSSEDAAGKIKTLEADKAGLEAARKALEDEKGQLQGEVKNKDAELAKLKATYDSLQDKMKDEIKKGDIRLTQSGGKIQVDMVDKILFDSGQAELSPHGADVLGRVGGVLAGVEDKQIQVSGHTDDSPPSKQLSATFPTNWELSVSRAVNVVRFLSEKANVPAKRLIAAGYGQFHPISTNANPDGRARNRRIEILLTPALDAKSATLTADATPPKVAAKSSKGKVVSAKATSKSKKKTAHR